MEGLPFSDATFAEIATMKVRKRNLVEEITTRMGASIAGVKVYYKVYSATHAKLLPNSHPHALVCRRITVTGTHLSAEQIVKKK